MYIFVGCTSVASTSACAIPIRRGQQTSGSHYAKYNAWSVNDNYLDWYGAEQNQGRYNGAVAEGTPAVWTTNVVGSPGYSKLNTLVFMSLILADSHILTLRL